MKTKIGCIAALLVTGLLLLVLLPGLVSFYLDWLWFQEVGYESVFTKTYSTRFGLWVASFLLAYLVLYWNWWYAQRSIPIASRQWRLDAEGVQVIDIGRHSSKLGRPIAILFGFLVAQVISGDFQTLLAYLHPTAFGASDPVFARDISFYFFTLPVWEGVTSLALWLVGLSWLLVLGLAWIRNAVRLEPSGLWILPQARGQLSLLGALLFLVLAVQAYLRLPNLLHSSRGPTQGASYADIHVVVPALWLLVASSVVAALMIAANYLKKRRFLVLSAVGLYVGVLVVGSEIAPQLVQKFVVAPNELVNETPYILHNIAATRKAFGLEKVEERDIAGEANLTLKDIENNAATLRNIRLWDHRPLLDTFAQIQEIRTYYDFVSVDNDRYLIHGEDRQIMLSPRELSPQNLPDRRWLNEHLTYTHGFGLTMGPVNQVTPDGLPVLMVKDIPPVSSVDSIQIKRPEIYFGENTDYYVFVRTQNQEFNYPSGEANVYSSYEGKGGVPVGSLWRKVLLALHFQTLNIALPSSPITAESRVLYYRNIRERVQKVAPFLLLDRDPYLVVTQEGRLVWICDAYTVSNRYPYSQKTGSGINYIRNSVKVTIDAYDGTIRFFLIDPGDPLAATYSKIFPGLFRPFSEMSADLQSHLRYPEDLFTLQTLVYSTYHMSQAQIFYNREDQWEIPVQEAGQQRMDPYYTIMKLPGEKGEEFILMLPFTPRGKDNLSAWIVGRSDAPHYGQLVAYRFPKQKLVFGPKQIENRISQDTVISQEVTLWDQRGSQVTHGTLLVIPLEESLIYVRPLYIRAEGGKIPELKRVVVAYENRIAMGATLDEAIAKVFGVAGTETLAASAATAPSAAPAAAPGTGSLSGNAAADLAMQARQHYERAIEAQRQGNWALYGEEIKKLGDVLQRMHPRK